MPTCTTHGTHTGRTRSRHDARPGHLRVRLTALGEAVLDRLCPMPKKAEDLDALLKAYGSLLQAAPRVQNDEVGWVYGHAARDIVLPTAGGPTTIFRGTACLIQRQPGGGVRVVSEDHFMMDPVHVADDDVRIHRAFHVPER